MKIKNHSKILALASLLVLQAAVGCGGGGHHDSPAPKGRLAVTIAWPESQTRTIPTAAQSILVKVLDGSNNVVASTVIVRPASTATLTDVPVGSFTVTVNAFASTDGTGTALATANVGISVTENNTSNVDLTMASTIDHLDVSPSPLTLGAGLTNTFIVTAKDANGNTVLVSPTSIGFSSSNSSVVAVNALGVATAGNSVGTASITITEADSGKTVVVPVSIVPNVTVSPTTASVTVRATKQFSATVVGPADASVTWSVQEGASGGTVSASGLYTAPSTRGTYHVIAKSNADNTRTATATIVVGAGNINVGVH